MNREALLRAVLDSPDDDAPRLVYADWLEEYGGEADQRRARFIRLGIDYNRWHDLPCHCLTSERTAGRSVNCTRCIQVTRLKRQHRDYRDMRYPDYNSVYLFDDDPYHLMKLYDYTAGRVEWDWARGFVQEIRCPLIMWWQHGPLLVEHHPMVKVEITDRRPNDQIRENNRMGFYWIYDERWPAPADGPHGDEPNYIPLTLWRLCHDQFKHLLDGKRLLDGGGERHTPAWSEQEANEVLGEACLTWARGAANDA